MQTKEKEELAEAGSLIAFCVVLFLLIKLAHKFF
jgi:hypothetical protein